MSRNRLEQRVGALIDGAADFDEVALAVYEHQRRFCPEYASWCADRAAGAVTRWREIPLLPIAAFRRWDLRTFPPEETVATFLSSGTTSDNRSRHHFRTLAPYRHAALHGFARGFALADGQRVRIVSLIEGAETAPESSLSTMVSWVIDEFGLPDSRIDPDGETLAGLDEVPTLILGTSFGWANLFDRQPELRLPPTVRVMETGGFKGYRRELSRAELHDRFRAAGVSAAAIIGEYGMTELSSQWYDRSESDGRRVYRGSPAARVRIVDPATLADVAPGDVGLIAVVDPVNVGSVAAILTEDLGERVALAGEPDGFIYRGRATGAAVRGCSIRDEVTA